MNISVKLLPTLKTMGATWQLSFCEVTTVGMDQEAKHNSRSSIPAEAATAQGCLDMGQPSTLGSGVQEPSWAVMQGCEEPGQVCVPAMGTLLLPHGATSAPGPCSCPALLWPPGWPQTLSLLHNVCCPVALKYSSLRLEKIIQFQNLGFSPMAKI